MEEGMEQTFEHSLTPKQREVAYAMVRGDRTLSEVLERLGVSEDEFTGWVCDGMFTEYAASLARGFAEADAPYVWKVLLDLTRNGSVSAIRLYFDILNKKPAVRGGERAVGMELAGLRESIFAEQAEPESGEVLS